MVTVTRDWRSAHLTGKCNKWHVMVANGASFYRRLSKVALFCFSCTALKFRCFTVSNLAHYRYKTWVTNPKLAQEMAEKVTRKTIGVRCCPVPGIPPPSEEEEELLELTNELNLM